jgi:hypothetical protein
MIAPAPISSRRELETIANRSICDALQTITLFATPIPFSMASRKYPGANIAALVAKEQSLAVANAYIAECVSVLVLLVFSVLCQCFNNNVSTLAVKVIYEHQPCGTARTKMPKLQLSSDVKECTPDNLVDLPRSKSSFIHFRFPELAKKCDRSTKP